MRILLIGDLHLRAKKLKDVASAWQSAIGWAHKNNVNLIIQAGDVFDHANVYGREASTGTIYGAFLGPFVNETQPLPLFLIPGNHDIGSPKDKDALSPIDRYPWISVVRKPGVHQINDEFSIAAVPWINRVHLISRLLSKGMKVEDASLKVNNLIAELMSPLAVETKKHQDAGRFVLFVGHIEVTGASVNGLAQHGGSFEFSSGDLHSVGADAYALAHIHTRQHIANLPNSNDGYLGCLCQLKYGEEGNEVGCRLIEIKDRKLVLDRWLDNKTSPKYFTVSTLEGLKYRPGIDNVKLRNIVKPDSLPEGVQFERLPQQLQARLRSDEKLDCDMSLRTLLAAWRNVTGCEVDLDLLVSEAEKIYSQCQIQSEAIGSLERIERIKVKNLTCHADTEIDMNVSGICGLAGPNGSGKTTAIEAIMLALYGISPSRPAIQSMIPKGDSVESSVEVEFISAGQKYIARREFVKTRKSFGHKAFILDPEKLKTVEKAEEAALASGVDGTYQYISQLVGDCDLVLAGIFSSQGDSGNLVKQKPAQRKELFAKLLGTEKFLVLSKAADKIADFDRASIQAQKARFETIRNELAVEAQDKASIEALTKAVEELQKQLEAGQQGLKVLSTQLTDMEHSQHERNRLAQVVVDLNKKREKIIADGKALKQQKKDLENLSTDGVEEELIAARKAREDADAITAQIADAAQKQLDFEREYNQLKATGETRLKEINDKIKDVINKKEKIESDLTEAKRRTTLLKGFPDLPACQTCPLAKDSIDSRNTIPELEAKLVAIEEKQKKGESVSVRAMKDHFDALKAKKESFESIDVSALKNERTKLLKQSSKIIELETILRKASNAKNEVSKIDGMIEAAKNNVKDTDKEITDATAVFSETTYSEDAHQKVINAANLLNFQIKKISGDISNSNIEVGKFKARIEQHASRRNEANVLLKDITLKESNAAVYEALSKAFGRDGIPQLIVDSAIPHLQQIMFDMMSEIDGKWAIRITTQRETQKGTTQERIEILVDDGDDERDISTYSGGEMNLLSTVIRIAFSILQAERSGKGLKVLVLDEAMYFADNEYSDAFMRMLKKLPQFFNQIFIISHSEFVLSSIENKIFFARTSNGKTVVQSDFK